jgi:hypothetical protein
MIEAEYVVYVTNSAGVNIVVMDTFSKIEIIQKYNNVGTFLLEVDENEQSDLLDFGGGINVYRDATLFFSGKVAKMQRRWQASGKTLMVSGRDNINLLSNRVVYPGAYPFAAAQFDTRTGKAETVIKDYVYYNCGAGAALERQEIGLTVQVDIGAGNTITGQGRLQNLLQFIRSLAAAGEVGFRFAGLEFQVYQPRDLTGLIIFSEELGSLESYDYYVEAPLADFIIAGGSGSGTGRTFATAGDWTAIGRYGRIEGFKDLRSSGSTSGSAGLMQGIESELAQKSSKLSLKFTPGRLARMMPVSDYWLGDKITAIIRGVQISGVVGEIKASVSAAGEIITVSVAEEGGLPWVSVFDPYRTARAEALDLQNRISNLEVE